MALFDDNGDEVVGAKTADEVEAEIKAAADAARAEVEGKTKEQLDALTKERDDLAKKDHNFRQLENLTEEQKKEKLAVEKQLKEKDDLLLAAKNEAKNFVIGTYKDNQVDKLAGKDAKLKESIQAHLKNISGPEDTQDQINTKLRSAYVLATNDLGQKPSAGILNEDFGGGGGGRPASGSSANSVSSELQALGRERFGLTDKDWEMFDKPAHILTKE